MTDFALDSVADLKSIVGERSRPRVAKYPVNEAMIGLWCDAVGDDNPAYQDADWAAASRWGGIIAPATSLNMWCLPGYRRTHSPGEPLDVVTHTLNRAGFTSVAAVNNIHDYVRPLVPGDHLSQIQYLDRISEEKQTSLGRGHFFDVVADFVTQHDELVGKATLRIFKWQPGTGVARPAPATGPDVKTDEAAVAALAPVAADRETLTAAQLEPGMLIREWSMPVTATRIAALAAATMDFNDFHFDPDAAHAAGAKATYMNIQGSSGLMNRYVTDWVGPEAVFVSADVQLRAQNHPGDTVTYSGRVLTKERAVEGRCLVTIEVTGANSLGIQSYSVVKLSLLAGADQ